MSHSGPDGQHYGQGVFWPRHYYPALPHAQRRLPHTYFIHDGSAPPPARARLPHTYFIHEAPPPPIALPRPPDPPPYVGPPPHHPSPYPSAPPPVVVRPPPLPPHVPPPHVPAPQLPPRPSPQPPPAEGRDYSRSAIHAAMKGRLAGRGDLVIETALRHGLNPAFFAAVIMKESNGGSSRAATDGRNNFTGISGSGRPQHLGSTAEEGLEKGARLLARYLSRHGNGVNAISAIGRIYAPVGASNDPYGTNGTWPSGVLSFFRRFGGQQSLAAPRGTTPAPHGPPQEVARMRQEAGYAAEEYNTGEAPSGTQGETPSARRRRQHEDVLSRLARAATPQGGMPFMRRRPGMNPFDAFGGLSG